MGRIRNPHAPTAAERMKASRHRRQVGTVEVDPDVLARLRAIRDASNAPTLGAVVRRLLDASGAA